MKIRPGHGLINSDPVLTGILIKGTCKYERKKSHNNLIAKNKYLYFDQKPDPRLGISQRIWELDTLCFPKKFKIKICCVIKYFNYDI